MSLFKINVLLGACGRTASYHDINPGLTFALCNNAARWREAVINEHNYLRIVLFFPI